MQFENQKHKRTLISEHHLRNCSVVECRNVPSGQLNKTYKNKNKKEKRQALAKGGIFS